MIARQQAEVSAVAGLAVLKMGVVVGGQIRPTELVNMFSICKRRFSHLSSILGIGLTGTKNSIPVSSKY